jgi:antirestriction protein
MQNELKIYVACLASYNNGCLHGAWIECEGKSADELQEEISTKVLQTSKFPNVMVEVAGKMVPSSEEFAIHDHEGAFGLIEEYSPLSYVAQLAEMIAEHGEAYALYAKNLGGSELPSGEDFQEHYQGEFEHEEAFAESFAAATGLFDTCPQTVVNHFDMQSYAGELFQDGFNGESLSNGNIAVFNS